MNIIAYIFEPAVFFSILAVLFAAALLIVFSFLRYDKKLTREIQEKAKKDKLRISELEEKLAVANQMYEGLKEQYSELEKDLEKLTKELERQP